MINLITDYTALEIAYQSPNPSWETCTTYALYLLSKKFSQSDPNFELAVTAAVTKVCSSVNKNRLDPVFFRLLLQLCQNSEKLSITRQQLNAVLSQIDVAITDPIMDLCKLLRSQGYIDEALTILSNSLEHQIEEPELVKVSIYNEIALCMLEKGKTKNSIEVLAHSLQVDPQNTQTHSILANVYAISDHGEDALKHRKYINKINPLHFNKDIGLDFWAASRGASFHIREELRKDYVKCLQSNDIAKITQIPFATLLATDDPELILKSNQEYARQFQQTKRKRSRSQVNNKVRVGYVSPDFRNHAVTLLIKDLIGEHDRDQFEIFGYALLPSDNSQFALEIQGKFDKFIDISQLPTPDAAKYLNNEKLDIAVDLAGYTRGSFPGLFEKLECITVNYLGYPSTTGSTGHDYIIADKIVIPEDSQHFFSEIVAYIDCCYQCNSPQKDVIRTTREEQGLPTDCFIFSNFNATQKINLETLRAWKNILKSCDDSILFMMDGANTPEVIDFFHPFDNRVFFGKSLYNPSHLGRVALCDLFLDTFPYGAHTTASDAIFSGVPILSWSGKSFQSRVSKSLMHFSGERELDFSSSDEFTIASIEFYKNFSNSVKDRYLKSLTNFGKKGHPYNVSNTCREIERVFSEIAR